MKISVIIPTWNRSSYLPRALESVFAQSVLPHEVIVVDDGSTDNSREIIKRDFRDVRYLYQENRGVSSARNTGILAAGGDWIALLDSDDRWEPHKLERQQHALQARPDATMCHSNETWIRNGKRVNPMNKHAKRGGLIFQHCLPLCAISPSAAVIKRELFDEIGLFDEALPACEDYDLWLRICATHPVLYLEEPLLIKYGGHADQLSRRHWGMDRFRIHALEKILGTGTLTAEDHAAALGMLQKKIGIVIQGADKRNNTELANRYRDKLQACLPVQTAHHAAALP
jgi:glycosyltransferase involved in cell wall biosynthesis